MKASFVVAVLSVFALLQLSAAGEPDCCARCGCKCRVHKVCRLVWEEKETKEVQWTCKCEDFCVPGRSELCGEKCECDPSKPHGEDCDKVWNPTECAKVRTRNILVKNEVAKKKPGYKWVVEYCCDRCDQAGTAGDASPTIPLRFDLADRPKLPWTSFFK